MLVQNGWISRDHMATEMELGDVLYGLIRMCKPDLVVETGTYKGDTTKRLVEAVLINQKGRVVTCDTEIHPVPLYSDGVTLQFKHCSSLELPELREADLVFSDSGYSEEDMFLRAAEYRLCKTGCIFVAHDAYTFPGMGVFIRSNGGIVFPFSRGFGIMIK